MVPVAILLDVDGVLTDTASRHERAWRALFDEVCELPLSHAEYATFIDGKPRREGLRAVLDARGITVADAEMERLATRKNELYLAILDRDGAPAFSDARRQLARWRDQGLPVAAASASRNMPRVLARARLPVDLAVDGNEVSDGKPALFLEAARRLGVAPANVLLVEDAAPGVAAGRRAGFGCVVGLARDGDAARLWRAGAHRVVRSLTDLEPLTGKLRRPGVLPSAMTIALGGRTPIVLLDYDGTLTPIVADPDRAVLAEGMRDVLRGLRCPVAVISGRDRRRLEAWVGLDGLWYAGSHGFDIRGPDGRSFVHPLGMSALPALDLAESALRVRLDGVPGVLVERKRFALAVHWRNVAAALREGVWRAVAEERDRHPELRLGTGRKVTELRPAAPWNKGEAVTWLLGAIGRPDGVPIYVGDDLTDEDAFLALPEGGVGVLVGCPDRVTAATMRVEHVGEVEQLLRRLGDG